MSSEDWEDRNREKSDKHRKSHSDKVQAKLDRKKKHDDAPYLNSTSRVTKTFIISIVEFVIIFIVISLLTTYLDTGTLDVGALPDTIATYLRPGGVILTALLAFLPIMVLENIGVYFGLGTYPRMFFGIVKYIALSIWLGTIVFSLGDLDLVKLAPISESALGGLVSLTVNFEPLAKLLIMILLLCCIIPVAEFIGCRKKHNTAMRHRQERKRHRKEKNRHKNNDEVNYDDYEEEEYEESEDSSIEESGDDGKGSK